MIDPLEAVIRLCKETGGLNTITGGRIDDRHHYGQDTGDWPQDAKALTLMPVGGPSDNYLPVQSFQMDAYCYGDTFYEAGRVFRELRSMTPANRRIVTVGDDKALIYYVVIASQLRRFLDDEARPNGGMPCYLVQLSAEVAEQAVP